MSEKESRIWISIKEGKMDIEVDMVADANTMPLVKMLLDFKGEFYPDDIGDDPFGLKAAAGDSPELVR